MFCFEAVLLCHIGTNNLLLLKIIGVDFNDDPDPKHCAQNSKLCVKCKSA